MLNVECVVLCLDTHICVYLGDISPISFLSIDTANVICIHNNSYAMLFPHLRTLWCVFFSFHNIYLTLYIAACSALDCQRTAPIPTSGTCWVPFQYHPWLSWPSWFNFFGKAGLRVICKRILWCRYAWTTTVKEMCYVFCRASTAFM